VRCGAERIQDTAAAIEKRIGTYQNNHKMHNYADAIHAISVKSLQNQPFCELHNAV
jgi:hypothetical protein